MNNRKHGGRRATTSVFLAAVLFAAPLVQAGDAPEGYYASVEAWRAGRLERLKAPSGYLSLAGLYWLDEGTHTFGSDPANDFVLPEGRAPAHMGSFTMQGDVVTIEVRDGVEVTHDGEPVGKLRMYDDHDGENDPTVLEFGTLSWYVVRRGERLGIRLKDSESELRRNFGEIEHYPVDHVWRIEGVLEPYPANTMIPIENILDQVLPNPSPGTLVFEIDGTTYRLDALGRRDAEQFFIIFGDVTNGKETYAGGRFLYVDAPGDDGRVVIDFNKAYNPPCAFSPYSTCQLPPAQNRLPIRVTAGEKLYAATKH